MFDLERLREAVRDLLDQLDRGDWRDEHEHDVKKNLAVLRLRDLVGDD